MFEIGPIVLRSWEKDDLKKIHQWENDFQLMLYSRGRPHNMEPYENTLDYFEEERKNEKHLHYVIVLKSSNEAIGTATIRLDRWGGVRNGNIGTYLDKNYWNKGYGKIVTLALLELSFHLLNLDRCEAWSIEYNKRAHHVLEECGFKRMGIHRKSSYVLGRRWDWYYFDILKEEYLKMRDELIRKILGDAAEEYLKDVSLPETSSDKRNIAGRK